jgi:cytochrome c553
MQEIPAMKRMLLLGLACLPLSGQAVDLENGERIARSCALCHGQYGQGTPGPISPRLAGMPQGYLIKQLEHYQSGERKNDRMYILASLSKLSEEDIDDVSAYYATLNLDKVGLPNHVPLWPGDTEEGAELYDDDCKSCHRKNGMGRSRKGVPALALQYSQYLFTQLKMFQWRKRVHDDDPEDETFDDYTDQQLENILAYVSTLAQPEQDKK